MSLIIIQSLSIALATFIGHESNISIIIIATYYQHYIATYYQHYIATYYQHYIATYLYIIVCVVVG